MSTRAPWNRRGASDLRGALAPHIEAAAPHAGNHLVRARAAWFAACGPHLARHSEPVGWDGPLLQVAVEPAWRELLFEQRSRITGRLRRWLPRVRGVRLVTRRLQPLRPRPPKPEPAPPHPESVGIADADLRSAVDALLRARDRKEE